MASSAINISDKGIPLYVIPEIFLIFRLAPYIFNNLNLKLYELIFIFFILYSVLLLSFIPNIFSGMIVTLDYDLLKFSFSNYIQILYLILNFLIIYGLRLYGNVNGRNFNFYYYLKIPTIVCLSFGYIFYFSKIYGFSGYISPYIFNNIGYSQAADAFDLLRFQAGFPEASYCGAFISAMFWLSFYNNRYIISVFLLIACIISVSATAILGLVFGLFIYFILKMESISKGLIALFFFLILAVVFYAFGLFDILNNYFNDKSQSHSANVRSLQLDFALNLIRETNYFGVGLGVTRGGGFLVNMIASNGIIGAFIFFFFLINLLINFFSKHAFIYFFVLFVAMAVSIPDISYPILWVSIFALLVSKKT